MAADARQDRLHLQVLRQAFPDAIVVSDLKELERRRLGTPPSSLAGCPGTTTSPEARIMRASFFLY